jgi:ACS family tartrate transporter-like MFS transporter
MGPFWALATRRIEGAAAAGGVAMITMIGGFGGFLGPYVTGRLRDATHSYSAGLVAIGGLALIGAALALARDGKRADPEQRLRLSADGFELRAESEAKGGKLEL